MMSTRFLVLAGSAIASALVICFLGRPAFAQSSDFAFEVPGVSNFVAGAVGLVPDYLGSDDYRFGAAPAALISFGDTKRYARLVVTDLNVNLLDNENWSFGPAVNWRFGRSDVDDYAVDRMRDIDGTVEVGAFGGWTWVGQNDPRHRILGRHGGPVRRGRRA